MGAKAALFETHLPGGRKCKASSMSPNKKEDGWCLLLIWIINHFLKIFSGTQRYIESPNLWGNIIEI